jgi:virginiamycin B lyase
MRSRALLTAILGGLFAAASSQAAVFHQYAIPTPSSAPTQIGGGKNFGAYGFWFSEFAANRIGRVDSHGVVTETVLPTPDSGPWAVAPGVDYIGRIAFTELRSNTIGQLDQVGALREFAIPTPASNPRGIAPGDSGYTWFTEYDGNRIWLLYQYGLTETIMEFPLPSPSGGLLGIAYVPAVGGASEVWFTEFLANRIGRIHINRGAPLRAAVGPIAEYPIPTPDSGPTSIVFADDGNDVVLWFTEYDANKIGRITAEGVITEYPIPTPASGPTDIRVGRDGVWFTERLAHKLGRLSFDGVFREFALPDGADPVGLDIGSTDDQGMTSLTSVWYLDATSNAIGRLSDDFILAVGAGHVGAWDTEFEVSTNDGLPPQARVGLAPPSVCPLSCPDPGIVLELSAGEVRVNASDIASDGREIDSFGFRISGYPFGGITDLPDVVARIVNRNRPGQTAELPLVRYWMVADRNPSVLRFPAVRAKGIHSNLLIAGVSNLFAIFGPPMTLSVEAVAFGVSLAGAQMTLYTGQTRMLVDLLGALGLPNFDGEIRVTRVDGSGLIWGLLATVHDDGGLELIPPTVSTGGDP